MSMRTDTAILELLPELTTVEFTLLMALSQATGTGAITRHVYVSVLNKTGLSESKAHRILAGLALHDLAHLQLPTTERAGIFRVRGGDEE